MQQESILGRAPFIYMIFYLPWCVIGDFNEFLHSNEKIVGVALPMGKKKKLVIYKRSSMMLML